ncbi:FAD-dependent oxidoreductase [Sorangium sp. So ce321]|uniref:flavin monoamine oxidase family protein n=1 Tax=Sorangium sp. So ce321 TaxID=3133300 RepID=UPI003F610B1E
MNATRTPTGARARVGLEDLRIAVVGAGPAGLTAAHTLKKLGYRHVAVFERSEAVGGKACTLEHGGHTYEMGAIWLSSDYEVVNQLAAEVGIATKAYRVKKYQVEADGSRMTFAAVAKKKYGAAAVARALLNYAKVRARYARAFAPGFAGAPPAVRANFSEFAEAHGFAPLADMLRAFTVACGYGYYEEVPAQYLLKLFNWIVRIALRDAANEALGLRLPGLVVPEGGAQRIWTELARTLDVRLRSAVTRVARTARGIALTVNGEVQTFDRVIVSAALDQASTFMEFPADVAGMIKGLRTYRCHISLVEVEGVERQNTSFFYENMFRKNMGRMLVLGTRYADTNLFTTNQISDGSIPEDELERLLEADVARYGGKVVRVVAKRSWVYFPHFPRELLDAGVYERLEALQGKDGIFLVGGTMSFESLEDSARYARDLVIEHFSDRAAPSIAPRAGRRPQTVAEVTS